MQIVDLKTEGAGLHGVARLTFKCGSENIFGKRQTCAFWLCVAGICTSTMPLRERHRVMKGILSMWSMEDGDQDTAYA